jgi:cytochrome c oxidase subunit II
MKLKVLTTSFVLAVLTAIFFFAHLSNAQEAPKRIEIVAKRFDFTPGEVTLKKGVPVVIAFTSKDVAHGVKFKELNLVIASGKGETKEITYTPTQTGTFVGQCSVFCGSGHGGMKMTLHVTE